MQKFIEELFKCEKTTVESILLVKNNSINIIGVLDLAEILLCIIGLELQEKFLLQLQHVMKEVN